MKFSDNLQAFFTDQNTELLNNITRMDSAGKRLKAYFEAFPNKIIEPYKLSVIANVRDWERTLRLIRQKEQMQIQWIKPNPQNPMGGYIYTPNK